MSLPLKILRIAGALLAILVGLYPVLYLINGHHFRLLATKDAALLASIAWNAVFYLHITVSGLALLTGWLQFSNRLRLERPSVHRTIGKIYLICAVAGGLAGSGLALTATGGIVPAAGFFGLGMTWVSTTIQGYRSIRQHNIKSHYKWTIYSYACCFAAVTLRLWLTLLGSWLSFDTAYPIVAWLSWLPNLLAAWLIVRHSLLPVTGGGLKKA